MFEPSQPIPLENNNNPRVLPYYTTMVRYSTYGIEKLPVKFSQPPHQVLGAAAGENRDENPIHILGDYSDGYRNTIDIPIGNNVITSSYEICSGPHDTRYCMKNSEQAFVEYASSRTDEAGVLSTHSYLTNDPQCSTHIHGSINTIIVYPKQQSNSHDDKSEENDEEEENKTKNIDTNPSTPPDPSLSGIEFVCTKGDDGHVMFIEIVKKNADSRKEEAKAGGLEVDYFDIFPTRSKLACHKDQMGGSIPLIFLRNPIITEGCPSNIKIPRNIGHVHVEKAYIDLNSPLNIMTRMMYNWIIRRKHNHMENPDVRVSNFMGRIKGMHVRFTNRTDEITYKMPHMIEQCNSLSDLEKEHTKSVYLRNKEDKRRRVEYVMSKILGFYKECIELGLEYLTGVADEGEVK
ncbi:hypothetical protein Tco_0757762 [Tanacetum coccineum]